MTTVCAALPVGASAADESVMSPAGKVGAESPSLQPVALENAVMDITMQRAAAAELKEPDAGTPNATVTAPPPRASTPLVPAADLAPARSPSAPVAPTVVSMPAALPGQPVIAQPAAQEPPPANNIAPDNALMPTPSAATPARDAAAPMPMPVSAATPVRDADAPMPVSAATPGRDADAASAPTGPVLESPFAGAAAPARLEKTASGDEPAVVVDGESDPDLADEPAADKTAKAARSELRDALKNGKRNKDPIKAQTIVDFQRFKQVEQQTFAEDGKTGKATLVNLNANVNSWFLLTIKYGDGRRDDRMHLENADPRGQTVSLPAGKTGFVFTSNGQTSTCDLWAKDFQDDVKKARDNRSAFAALCDGKLFLRTKVDGRKTTKEWVVEFLRENVWGGEAITSFVKDKFFKDKFLISSDAENGDAARHKDDSAGPRAAQIDARFANQLIEPAQLAISVKREDGNKMLLGRWYENPANRGVFVSAAIPDKIDPDLLKSYPNLVSKLDGVESSAVDYLVGFDMSRFDIGFAVGTDHPQVDWSERALPDAVDRSVGGPDGFGSWDPLVTTGMVNPSFTKSIAAVFTGGFKRDHGSFKWGPLAGVNHASHYGFVESGVVFSKLNPGLSTIAVYKDGSFVMKTWTDADDDTVKDVVFARQNGVALIETDPATGASKPGENVKNWGAGNWSGSEDSKFRTLRAGLCLQEHAGRKFLLYGYFSSVTPSTMARVFQAYGCGYAMHLDMNALEHTYLSVFPNDGKSVTYEHLISGMKAVDKSFADKTIPRFIGFPDNRDFFYLWRKKE